MLHLAFKESVGVQEPPIETWNPQKPVTVSGNIVETASDVKDFVCFISSNIFLKFLSVLNC